jgi:hypothetical protein
VVIAVLAVVTVVVALVLLDVVTLPIGMALVVVALFGVVAIGQRRDRGRQRGMTDGVRRLDARRGVVPTAAEPRSDGFSGLSHWEVDVATQPPPRDRS